jgi:hypothetical protein
MIIIIVVVVVNSMTMAATVIVNGSLVDKWGSYDLAKTQQKCSFLRIKPCGIA